MTIPTQEQIKADVVSLLPGMIESVAPTVHASDGLPHQHRTFWWRNTGQQITSREWLMVAHEAEKIVYERQLRSWWDYKRELYLLCGDDMFRAASDQRLEAIHRVCFPEKWRDA